MDNLPKNGDWSNHYFLCDYRLTFIDFLSSSYFLLLFPLLFFLSLFFSFIIQTSIRPWKYAHFHVLEISLWLMWAWTVLLAYLSSTFHPCPPSAEVLWCYAMTVLYGCGSQYKWGKLACGNLVNINKLCIIFFVLNLRFCSWYCHTFSLLL